MTAPPIRKPYLKFYGRDWLGDPALRMISPAARGVWIDLLCIMSMAVPYGHLTIHGAPMADDQAARVCGLPLAEYAALLASIEAAGVSSRTPDGVLYCRRLVRDHAAYAVYADAGRRGGGNPRLRAGDSEADADTTPETPPTPPCTHEQKDKARSQKPEATVGLNLPFKPTFKGADKPHPRAIKTPETALQALDRLRPVYAALGIDVDRELVKCRAWCNAKGIKEPTLPRFTNWLNRADQRPSGQTATPASLHRGMAETIKVRKI